VLTRIILVFFILAFGRPVIAEDATTFSFIGAKGAGKSTVIKVLNASNGPGAIVINPGQDGAVYGDFVARKILITDARRKEFMDLGAMADMMRKSGMLGKNKSSGSTAKLDAAHEILRKSIEDAIANMPEGDREAARKALEKQLGLTKKPKKKSSTVVQSFEIEETGETKRVGDLMTSQIYVRINGERSTELWVTDPANVEGGQGFVDALQELQKLFEELAGDLMSRGNPMKGDSTLFLGGVGQIDQFPVVVRTLELDEEYSLKSAQRRSIDPADFVPPAGYKLRQGFGG